MSAQRIESHRIGSLEVPERVVTLRLLVITALVVLGVLWWRLGPRPTHVRVVNVGARSFDVGWAGQKPAKGCVIAVQTGQIFRMTKVCAGRKTSAHLVRVDGLEPETRYRILLFVGARIVVRDLPIVTTAEVREEQPPLPQPGYGMVVDGNDQPLANTLIYLFTIAGGERYPAGAMTNSQGNYALDLAIVKEAGGTFVIDAVRDSVRWNRIETDIRISSPFPTIKI